MPTRSIERACKRSKFRAVAVKLTLCQLNKITLILASAAIRQDNFEMLRHFEIWLILLEEITNFFKYRAALLRILPPWLSIWLSSFLSKASCLDEELLGTVFAFYELFKSFIANPIVTFDMKLKKYWAAESTNKAIVIHLKFWCFFWSKHFHLDYLREFQR